MRKLLTTIAAFVLMLACLVPLACAEGNDAMNKLDLVVVIDQSDSMYKVDKETGKTTGSDTKHYRIEAAQLVLSLLDVKDSYGGVVMFRLNCINHEMFNEMWPMSRAKNRTDLFQAIADKSTDTGGYTDIGEALAQAVDMLKKRKAAGSTNDQAVILITDGQMDVPNEGANSVVLSEKAFNEAMQESIQSGITIHTVYLQYKTTDDTSKIQELASATGGKFLHVNKNAADLPNVFNEIFSSQIGSDLARVKADEKQPDSTRGTGYEMIPIEVPNNSVDEINIIVSKEGMDTDSIRIYDETGKEMPVDSNNLYMIETKHYLSYKIVDPEPGNWRLSFSATNADVNIQYVFSYNVGTTAILSTDKQDKHIDLAFKGTFTDNGTPSADHSLYNSIDASLTISRVWNEDNKEVVLHEEKVDVVPENGLSMYYMEFNLRKENEPLLAGNYEAVVTYQGYGLLRTHTIKFTLTNVPPVLKEETHKGFSFTFNDPDYESGVNKESDTINVSDYVENVDKDFHTYSIISQPDELTVELNPSTGEMTVTQKKKACDGEIIIRANDGDGGTVDFTLPVKVVNKSDKYADYGISLTIDGITPDADGIVWLGKGNVYTLRVTPTVDGAEMQSLAVTVNGEALPMEKQEDGSYTGPYTSATEITTYELAAAAKYGDAQNGTPVSAKLTAQVENNAPTAQKDVWNDTISSQMDGGGSVASWFDNWPLLGNMLGKQDGLIYWVNPSFWGDETGAVELNVAEFFKDADKADELVYTVKLNGSELALGDDNIATFTAEDCGIEATYELTITAKDLDNESAHVMVTFTTIDLAARSVKKIVTAAILAVIACIIFKIIRQACKPKFKKGMCFTLNLDGVPQPYTGYLPANRGKKKPVKFGKYYDGMIDHANIEKDDLNYLKVTPAYGNAIKVVMIEKPKNQNLSITAGTKTLNKKYAKAKLTSGQSISFQKDDGYVVEYSFSMASNDDYSAEL